MFVFIRNKFIYDCFISIQMSFNYYLIVASKYSNYLPTVVNITVVKTCFFFIELKFHKNLSRLMDRDSLILQIGMPKWKAFGGLKLKKCDEKLSKYLHSTSRYDSYRHVDEKFNWIIYVFTYNLFKLSAK